MLGRQKERRSDALTWRSLRGKEEERARFLVDARSVTPFQFSLRPKDHLISCFTRNRKNSPDAYLGRGGACLVLGRRRRTWEHAPHRFLHLDAHRIEFRGMHPAVSANPAYPENRPPGRQRARERGPRGFLRLDAGRIGFRGMHTAVFATVVRKPSRWRLENGSLGHPA